MVRGVCAPGPGPGSGGRRCGAQPSRAGGGGPVTGAVAVLAASPAADSGSEFPGVLDGVLLEGPAACLAAMLDQAFLAGAGWDPGSRVLSLPAGHPLLGRVVYPTGGCHAPPHRTRAARLCSPCFAP